MIGPSPPSPFFSARSLVGAAFLGLRLTLCLGKSRVPQEQREPDEGHAEADAHDTQRVLEGHVALDDGGALGCADRVLVGDGVGHGVGQLGERGVGLEGQVAFERAGEMLGPDGAGDGRAEAATNGVAGEVETRDDGDVFVLRGGLDGRLGWVGEETTGEAEQDLGADDAGFVGAVDVAAVVDQKAEGDHEETGTRDNEGLQTTRLVDDERRDHTGDDGEEGVKGRHPCGHGDAEIKGHV